MKLKRELNRTRLVIKKLFGVNDLLLNRIDNLENKSSLEKSQLNANKQQDNLNEFNLWQLKLVRKLRN